MNIRKIKNLLEDLIVEVKDSKKDPEIESWSAKTKADLDWIENALNKVDYDHFYWGRHKDDTIEPGFEFNIKMDISIPEEVSEFLSDEEIDEIFWDTVNREVEDFIDETKSKYSWIKDIYQVGRTGGWLAIVPDRDLFEDIEIIQRELRDYRDRFEEDIVEIFADKLENPESNWWREIMDEYDNFIEDSKYILKNAVKIFKDLDKIEKEINKRRREVERYISSMEFWEYYKAENT